MKPRRFFRHGRSRCFSSRATSPVMHGPLVLARDARLDGDVDAAVTFDFSQPDKIKLLPLPGDALPAAWLMFEAYDATGRTLRLCDFASAGNTWSEDSRYRVGCNPGDLIFSEEMRRVSLTN